jgi:hypothetical protein
VRHELCKPDDPVEAWKYEQQNWGLHAETNRAADLSSVATFNDPGDGAV